jgi:predicted phosphodiesterase
VRLGVISDVHANLDALTAIIAAVRRRGVDAWVSAGDLIGYGPHPNECVDVVGELGVAGVAGNHELIVLGRLPGAGSSERAQVSHHWTREALRDDVVEYLAALPLRLEIGPLVVTHGSLDDPEEYVRTAGQAAAQLNRLEHSHPAARLLVLGNTHRQLLVGQGEGAVTVRTGALTHLPASRRHVLNPGSVGQSRQWERPPRARAAVLDLEHGSVLFERIRYDVRAARRELERAGLPYRSLHAPPPLRAAVARRMRRLGALVRLQTHPEPERGPAGRSRTGEEGDAHGTP